MESTRLIHFTRDGEVRHLSKVFGWGETGKAEMGVWDSSFFFFIFINENFYGMNICKGYGADNNISPPTHLSFPRLQAWFSP